MMSVGVSVLADIETKKIEIVMNLITRIIVRGRSALYSIARLEIHFSVTSMNVQRHSALTGKVRVRECYHSAFLYMEILIQTSLYALVFSLIWGFRVGLSLQD